MAYHNRKPCLCHQVQQEGVRNWFRQADAAQQHRPPHNGGLAGKQESASNVHLFFLFEVEDTFLFFGLLERTAAA